MMTASFLETEEPRQAASAPAELIRALRTENTAMRDLVEAYRAALDSMGEAQRRQREAKAAMVERQAWVERQA